MSFIATFFAIDILEFQRDSLNNGPGGLHLSYVSRYTFGIGFGISLPLIIIAFFMSDTEGWMWRFKNWLGRAKPTKRPQAARQLEQRDRNLEMEKVRPSLEWNYRNVTRVETWGTDRSQDIPAASPV